MFEKPILLNVVRKMNQSQKALLFDKIEKEARDNEILYWGCSQAVLGALQRYIELGNCEAFKAASALAGGVGKAREVCGALLGGVLAIGLAYGRDKFENGKNAQEQPAYLEAMLRSARLCERFKETFGNLRCSDVKVFVRGDDYKNYTRFNTLESLQDHDKCADVTGPAARLAVEVMLDSTKLYIPEIQSQMADIRRVRSLQGN